MKSIDLSLYAVTPSGCPLSQIEAALRGGVTLLQLREKNLDPETFLEKALKVRELCRRYQTPLIINDQVSIALASDADGVHLGQSDMDARQARKLLGLDKIIGVTARTPELAQLAEKNGADYLGAGAVFGTKTKADARPLSVDEFSAVCHSVAIPVVAIGGIHAGNAAALSGSGLAGIAVVSGLFGAPDIEQAARELLAIGRHLKEGTR